MNRHDLGTSDPTWAPGPTLIERMLDVQMGAVRRGRATVLVGVALSNGLVALAGGGELLVRGAVGIANKLGVSTLFTGLVIVGAATSMPEMVASVQAVMAGSPEIAWGNIVGSNIANSELARGIA